MTRLPFCERKREKSREVPIQTVLLVAWELMGKLRSAAVLVCRILKIYSCPWVHA